MEYERTLKVEEIEVRQINIVDSKGTRRMAIFNGDSFPEAVMDGEVLSRNGNQNGAAGMLFYNEDGDECGGLVYANSGAMLMFDQHKQDQIIGFSYDEQQDGKREYGLNIWDRPDVPLREVIEIATPVMNMENGPEKQSEWKRLQAEGILGAQRMFAGHSQDGAISVSLSDKKGTPRLRMRVDSDDNPQIEFLNSRGEVVYRLPPDGISMD
ncbi:hypothetical protein [Alicyclobacillus fastidiosus]|uniref:hypothetical protein n=1 Tax=Alicyclobacillus fastidiosus TaxID=392011 RepID=UPI0023E9AE97|nr:hypothetical protein [Alicyclobacillus fastidiosus]GMA66003.1 hypothetical protein GCM10025859_64450 [Alicyclobacillus fastidiosus]